MSSELSKLRSERELLELRSFIQDLSNEDWQVRLRTIKALTGVRRTREFSEEAIPALLLLCDDSNTIVRQAAIPVLGDVGGGNPSVVKRLVTFLSSSDTSEIKASAYALGKLGPIAVVAIQDLLEVLKTQSEEAQKASSWALSMLGPDAVKPLTEALKSENKQVLAYVSSALGNMGPIAISALPTLIGLLTNENSSVRLESAKALGNLRAAPDVIKAIANLKTTLTDSDPDVRWAAAEALRKIGTDQAMAAWASYQEIPSTEAYLQQLKNEDKAVRLHAAEQLYTVISSESTLDTAIIEKALADTYYKVPIALCEALAKLGSEGLAISGALVALLQHEIAGVRAAALGCLGKISAVDCEEAIIERLVDPEKEVRFAAGLSLELLGTPKALKALKSFKWE